MIRSAFAVLCLAACASNLHAAQADWPREITRGDGTTCVIYGPQLDSLAGDTLLSRSAVSIQHSGDEAPVFGAALAWGNLPCYYWPAPAVDEPREIAAPGTPPITVAAMTRNS